MKEEIVKNRVMIVDDEKDLVHVLEKRLSSAGYLVSKAYSGEDALRLIKEEMPDLILLDVMMPEMDGYQVRARLKEDAYTAAIAIIFLTAKSSILDKKQGFEFGIDDYITKPFESSELLMRVDSILKRRKFYEEISMTDGLTGLHNINFLKKELKILFTVAKRYKYIFSLTLLDINGLKKINDTYGHITGDAALKTFASVAKEVLRESDIIIRYGGDEFVILLPGVDKKSALLAMGRLKEALAAKGFMLGPAGEKVPISFSVGVVEYKEDIENESKMLEAADAQMYIDKKEHREE
ncbi:MAG: diguanylate cyclase [Candidatus Omnitrophica bacterium]|nr:diguanylate cyclase [Candidatus Omnitrophota bacterium]